MFVMYQDCVSPHQIPLARELVKHLGTENFRYVYRDREQGDRVKLGWQMGGSESWFVHSGSHPKEALELVENADALLTMFRDVNLIKRRCAKGLNTFYDSERWFKPIMIGGGVRWRWSLPGWIKLLHPGYFKMAWQIAHLLKTQPNFYYLPIGPHATRDMCLLGVPPTKMIPWGYFVAPSILPRSQPRTPTITHALRVLWVGRMLNWKRVDTIIRAVAQVNKDLQKIPFTTTASNNTSITLTLVGAGPEEARLKKLAAKLALTANNQSLTTFLPPVPISQVRQLMQSHDIYVLSSSAFEGWGAVVNEALLEGMAVLGTYEAGAPAALLHETRLFHHGDWRTLAQKLSTLQQQLTTDVVVATLPSAYTLSGAVKRILEYI